MPNDRHQKRARWALNPQQVARRLGVRQACSTGYRNEDLYTYFTSNMAVSFK
tara:strand:- start:40508 stop:40663 length:156 start_codon:yes stop_codon:yes gene_type:complete